MHFGGKADQLTEKVSRVKLGPRGKMDLPAMDEAREAASCIDIMLTPNPEDTIERRWDDLCLIITACVRGQSLYDRLGVSEHKS